MKIKQFEVSLTTGETKTKETVVKKYRPPIKTNNKGRSYQSNIRQTYGRYLEEMFYKNELDAYEDKARTNEQLKRDFLEAFNKPLSLIKQFQRYQVTIGSYRFKYHKRTLYSQQEIPYILSLQYDERGIPVVGGKQHYKYISFDEVYERCIEFQIADPRFVPPEYIQGIRDRQNSGDKQWYDWNVPSNKWVESFQTKIRKLSGNKEMEVYNSVYFPPGWTREESQ